MDSKTSAKELKIGLSLPLNKAIYVDFLRAIEAMIDWDNNNGGWLIGGDHYKIQYVSHDEGETPDSATEVINKLVHQDKVKFLIGTHFVQKWHTITEANKVIAMAQILGEEPVHYKYVFNSTGLLLQNIAVPGWICKNYPNETKNYVISVADDMEGPPMPDIVFQAQYQPFGVLPKVFHYSPKTQDSHSVAIKALSMNPSMFTAWSGRESGWGNVYSAMRQAGYKGLIWAPPPLSTKALSEIMSPEALEGIINGAQVTDFGLVPNQVAKYFNTVWTAKYGRQNPPSTVMYFGLYFCLKNALIQAGSIDVEKVAAVMSSGMKFEDPSGSLQLLSRSEIKDDMNFECLGTYYLKQIINGQPKLLATINPDEALSLAREAINYTHTVRRPTQ